MLETDLILGTFATRHLSELDDKLLDQYESLLNRDDPEIWQWLTDKQPPPPEVNNEILKRIKAHMQNNPLNYSSLN